MGQDSGADVRTVGQRIRHHRERAGMSRALLGQLVGMSDGWIKAIETGRLLPPRLGKLIDLAAALRVDLSEITGIPISAATWSRTKHPALPQVRAALLDWDVDEQPVSAAGLAAQVRQAWELWHGSRRQRTAIAVVLPGLIRTARTSVRLLEGDERRSACTSLAQVCHLVQLFLCFQGVGELIYLNGVRAMDAAHESGDRHAIVGAAWYLNHIFRDQMLDPEERVEIATKAASLLRPEDGGEDLALWGLMQLAVALSHAKIGRDGDAWRAWDEADRAARALGSDYVHPWLIFGEGMVGGYAVTMNNDLARPGEAIRMADRLDLAVKMPSQTRRSFHLAEIAKAYEMRHEPVAAVHLLRQAAEVSPDTTRFSIFARQIVPEYQAKGGAIVRAEANRLAEDLGIPA